MRAVLGAPGHQRAGQARRDEPSLDLVELAVAEVSPRLRAGLLEQQNAREREKPEYDRNGDETPTYRHGTPVLMETRHCGRPCSCEPSQRPVGQLGRPRRPGCRAPLNRESHSLLPLGPGPTARRASYA